MKRWDIAALSFIFFIIILMWQRREAFPIFIDIYYHLSIAEMFRQAGGITLMDFLQFAPYGRVHMYPPLYHAILSFFLDLGVPVITLSKIASAITYPIFAFVTYFVSSRTYSRRVGMLALLLFSISSMVFIKTAYLGPSMMAVALCLLAFYSIHRKSYMPAAAFMTLALYTHVSIPHIFIAPFLVIAILDKEERKGILLSIIISYVIYLPYLWHILSNLGYLNTIEAISTNIVDMTLLLISLMGTFILIRQYSRERKNCIKLYPIVLALVLCVIYPFYAHRFWFHIYVPFTILGSIGLNGLLAAIEGAHPRVRGSSTVLAAAIILTIAFSYQPTYVYESSSLNYANGNLDDHDIGLAEGGFHFRASLFNTLMNSETIESFMDYIDPDLFGIAENIFLTTDKNDIIMIGDGNWGCFLTAITGRGCTNGMYREIEPYHPSVTDMTTTKAYVLFFIPTEGIEGAIVYPEQESCLVVRGREDVAKTVTPNPLMPLWKAWFLSGLFFVLAFSVFFPSRPYLKLNEGRN